MGCQAFTDQPEFDASKNLHMHMSMVFLQFGTSQNDEVTVFDMDRFYIPTAGKVTAVVKQQIERLKES